MARWMKPEEEMPEVEVGDRILLIVVERAWEKAPLMPRLVILEAEDESWTSPDPTYVGYSPEDGVLWAHEKDVCAIAHALELIR